MISYINKWGVKIHEWVNSLNSNTLKLDQAIPNPSNNECKIQFGENEKLNIGPKGFTEVNNVRHHKFEMKKYLLI